MDLKEARSLAMQAKLDIGRILDDLYEKTGIFVTDVRVTPVDTTKINSPSREIRYRVVLSSRVEF